MNVLQFIKLSHVDVIRPSSSLGKKLLLNLSVLLSCKIT